MIEKQTSMKDEFYDWLDQCPVQWFRDSDDGEGNPTYSFVSEK